MKYKNIKLGEAAEITMGQSPKSTYYNKEGMGIPFIQGVSTFGDNFPRIETYTTEYNKEAQKGDLLFSVRAPVGRINVANQTIAIGRGLASLKVKKGYSKSYIYYLFKKIGNQLDSIGSGTVFSSINKKELINLKIRVPEKLHDQCKIADRLRKIDEEIEINNQINDNLLELMDNLFYNFFPQINVGDDLIGSFIQNYDRFRKPLSKEQRSAISGKYRYIGAASVMDYINKYNFDGIYLLLGEDGTVIDNKGYPILQYVFGKFWPNNHTHVLKGKNISTEWLYLFFRQRKVLNIVTGAVQKKISQKNLNSLKFSHPNKEDYLKFNEIIQPLFSDIRIRIKENKRLHQLKQELLKQYF